MVATDNHNYLLQGVGIVTLGHPDLKVVTRTVQSTRKSRQNSVRRPHMSLQMVVSYNILGAYFTFFFLDEHVYNLAILAKQGTMYLTHTSSVAKMCCLRFLFINMSEFYFFLHSFNIFFEHI